jgi:tRNA(Ile)-lysidine synthase
LRNLITSFIREKQLFSPTDQLLLAVSGGMDSMVLLHILYELGYRPGVIHCNFQLRGAASDEDEAFVRQQADKLGLSFFSRRFATKAYAAQHKCSIQVAARDLRYAYFAEIIEQEDYKYLLTAHHLDDRLETFWLNFTRGTGWRGLAGLKARRGNIRRPLLAVNRQQIEAYQQAHQIAFREDESNAEDKYRRNYFRHHVLPALYEVTPDLAKRSATNFQQLEDMLSLYEERIDQYYAEWFHWEGQEAIVEITSLREHAVAATLSWELFSPYGFSREQTRQILTANSGSLLESSTHRLLIKEEELILQAYSDATQQEGILWPQDQLFIRFAERYTLSQTLAPVPAKFEPMPLRVYVNPAQLVWPLQLRYWQDGDRFAPLGMGGKHQKVQDFFVNNKIDRLRREQVPLLFNGNGELIWIVGHRLDERFKVPAGVSQVISFAFY